MSLVLWWVLLLLLRIPGCSIVRCVIQNETWRVQIAHVLYWGVVSVSGALVLPLLGHRQYC